MEDIREGASPRIFTLRENATAGTVVGSLRLRWTLINVFFEMKEGKSENGVVVVVVVVDTNGIYFSGEGNEVFAKICEEDSLPEDVSWVNVSGDPNLGLMTIREMVVRRGLATDKDAIYWHGLRTKPEDDPEWLLHMRRESPRAA